MAGYPEGLEFPWQLPGPLSVIRNWGRVGGTGHRGGPVGARVRSPQQPVLDTFGKKDCYLKSLLLGSSLWGSAKDVKKPGV